MARRTAIILGVVVLAPLVLVGALVLLCQSEWAERRLEKMTAERLHREVVLDDIRLHATWPPEVSLGKIRISNPAWAKTPALIDAEDLRAQVLVGPLLHRKLVIPNLTARVAHMGIEQGGERATWKFEDQEKGPSRIQLVRVALEDGQIYYADTDEDTALDVQAKGTLGASGEIHVTAAGKFRGENAKGSAVLPSLEPDPEMPIEFKGEATVGRTKLAAEGSVGSRMENFDFKFTVAGQTMADLKKTFGMVMPETLPYKLSGRLRHEGKEWAFDPFQGHVGDSDLRGTLAYRKGEPRPMLTANLQSKVLDFKDLGPIIGKGRPQPNAEAAGQERAELKAVNARVLPQGRIATERWDQMDADVHLKAERVLRPKALPLDTLSTHLILKDGILHLEPLDFGLAKGRVRTQIVIDSHFDPPVSTLKADMQNLQMGQLFPSLKTMQEAFGTVYGRADLKGRGASIGEMLATSDGKVVVAANGGRVSDLLVQLLEIDVAHAAMLLGTRKSQVDLNCAVGRFNVKAGVMEPEDFVVDTTETLVNVKGRVSLAEERLDLTTHGKGKSPSVFVLRSPIVLEGPFRKPAVHPKGGPILAQAGAAAALAAVSGPLAIVPFLDAGTAKNADCDKLLSAARADGAEKKAS